MCVDIAATDHGRHCALSPRENHIDFAVVAPDDPLVMGLRGSPARAGHPLLRPRGEAPPMIEGSKVFSKNLMQKYGIPTAEYEVFDDAEAGACLRAHHARCPLVVKADGLALGKGVLICKSTRGGRAGGQRTP